MYTHTHTHTFHTSLRVVVGALVALVLVWLPTGSPAAHAATPIIVTTSVDDTAADGQCSLREAIANANADSAVSQDCAAGSGADTIHFDLGSTPSTITLDSTLGTLFPRGALTIDGAGLVTISGDDQTQIIAQNQIGGQLTLAGLTLAHGLADGGTGGAVESREITLVVRDTTFAHNSTGTGVGGAVFQTGGSLTVSGSTFTDNHSGVGGAIALNLAAVSITNSTFAGNAASTSAGAIRGGLDASARISYSTFVGNSAPQGGAIARAATLTADVFQDNPTTTGGQCDSGVVDAGYNVSSDSSCATDATSLPSTDPQLDPAGLRDNGGPTQTVALTKNSPAVDLIVTGDAGCGSTQAADQRGFGRPFRFLVDQATACDAGAFELGSHPRQPGILALASTATSVNESNRSVTLTVTRTGGSDGPVSVDYSTTDDTATSPGDYTATTGTLHFADGQTTATVDVPITNDHVQEPTETFTFTLSAPGGGATLSTPTTETVTIHDDDVPGTLQLGQAATTIGEAAGHVTLTVDRVGGSDGAVSVGYATADGTATSPDDYIATTGTVDFADGQTTASIDIPITNDLVQESAETFSVTLSSPTAGATLGGPTTETVTVNDDDLAGSLRVSRATASVGEADGHVTVTVERVGGSSGPVSVRYTTNTGTAFHPGDYTAVAGILDFADGQTTATVDIPITDDFVPESDETFSFQISRPSGGATLRRLTTQTITINDDDHNGTIQLDAATASVGEADGHLTVTVDRDGGSDGPVSVGYATADGTATAPDDYAATTGTLHFADGQTTATIDIPVVDDHVTEPAETFNVTLGSPAGGATLGGSDTQTVTVRDDLPGTLQLGQSTASVGEGDGHARISVDRVGGSDGPVSVGYSTADVSAAAPGDYTATTGTVHFADGQTTATVDVPIADDHVHEPSETFTLTLSGPTGGALLGGPTTETVTIVDDDVPGTLQLRRSAVSVGERDGRVQVIVDRVGGADGPVSIGYSTLDGTATSPGDYTATSGRVLFTDGQTVAALDIAITDDLVAESTETFTLVLAGPTGGAALDGSTQTISIDDNDTPRRCTVTGTPGPDVLRGTPGADVVCAGSGDDVIDALGGDDVIRGGGGNDVIHGDRGDDTLRGGRGDDELHSGRGMDDLLGNPGRDLLQGGPGDDVLRGGPGHDRLLGGPGHNTLTQ